ncbi:hypothetical protein MPSEU_000916200 [Mayamaea pseudoterrestris]|nr:hypothetical protein MPSEU_000916200 [Mayamaea pseudoterrestris]
MKASLAKGIISGRRALRQQRRASLSPFPAAALGCGPLHLESSLLDDRSKTYQRFMSSATLREIPQQDITAQMASTQSNSMPNDYGSSNPQSLCLANISEFLKDLERAAAWNHGKPGKRHDSHLWEPEFCRSVVQKFDAFLSDAVAAKQYSNSQSTVSKEQAILLSPETVTLAVKALVKSHLETHELSTQIRSWERALGQLRQTPLTDHLSLRLLTANGKAGNIGRVLSLLQLRKARHYQPRHREFWYAITSLQAAQPKLRNIFCNDSEQPLIDNPTRWLDAILLNMHQRDFPLTAGLANHMLKCFVAGYSGKAVHHFYRVSRQAVLSLPVEERPANDVIENMPTQSVSFQPSDDEKQNDKYIGCYREQPVKVNVQYHAASPPFYKIPSQVRGKLLPDLRKENDSAKNSNTMNNRSEGGVFKIDRETDPNYSIPLSAAFSFAESLQHGACGHEGIRLNTGSYNVLIQACVQRGALWRAMHLVDEVMSSSDDASTKPNTMSFNLIIAGLARVGDVMTMQDYYHKLLAAQLQPDAWTVRAIVDGLLNLGDVSAAATVVQDLFNQHSVLPPYTTHMKILELCLGRSMVYEAKRHVYFLQQLWHWEPNEYHDEAFVKLMRATQRNTQLQKPALQQLFRYFGAELLDSDFL